MEFNNLIKERRSIGYFDPKKNIDDELLKKIINESTLTPSAFNFQPWELLIIRSKEARQKLFDNACKQPRVLEAPIIIAVLGKTKGYEIDNPIWDIKIKNKSLNIESKDKVLDICRNTLYSTPTKEIEFAIRNSSFFAMSIMYTAKNYGVDTHPMIGFNEEEVKKIFKIEKDKKVTMLIAMGYHDSTKTLYSREYRFSYEEICKEF